MVIVFTLLVIAYIFLNLFLVLRFGSDHPIWPVLAFLVLLFAVAIIGDKANLLDFPITILPIIFTPQLARVISIPILRKRAGNLILTYKRSMISLVGTLIGGSFFLYLSYMMSIPNVRSYPGGEPVYNEYFYHTELPFSIIVGLVGLFLISTIIHKGEFFENGLVTPDFQYFPWSGYKSYKWTENTQKKSDEQFSLFLEGGRNYSFTIHGFSDSTKKILEDTVLSARFPKKP